MLKKKHRPKKKKKVAHKRKRPAYLKLYPITITNQHGATHVHPDPQNVSVHGGDEVAWQGAADFTVDFNTPKGSPFASSHFSGGPGHPAYSGPPVPGKPYDDYKYTAQIAGATAIDPIIHTDP